jgi:serine/threonine-protein kinase
MGEILGALDLAHRHGIVHRDIKPGNIYLLEDGHAKVADFGIARMESSDLTQVGISLGTPPYMSPEQFTGDTLDGRSDLFSAAIILYQFLTNERPFQGNQASTIMHNVLERDPTPPSKLNFQVPAAFDAVLGKALAKRRDERYATAREFADALNAAAAGHAAVPTPVVSDVTDRRTTTPSQPAAAKPAGPARRVGVVLGVAAAFLLAIFCGLWLSHLLKANRTPPAQVATPAPVVPVAPVAPLRPSRSIPCRRSSASSTRAIATIA